jgi:hypothetical protein
MNELGHVDPAAKIRDPREWDDTTKGGFRLFWGRNSGHAEWLACGICLGTIGTIGIACSFRGTLCTFVSGSILLFQLDRYDYFESLSLIWNDRIDLTVETCGSLTEHF